MVSISRNHGLLGTHMKRPGNRPGPPDYLTSWTSISIIPAEDPPPTHSGRSAPSEGGGVRLDIYWLARGGSFWQGLYRHSRPSQQQVCLKPDNFVPTGEFPSFITLPPRPCEPARADQGLGIRHQLNPPHRGVVQIDQDPDFRFFVIFRFLA